MYDNSYRKTSAHYSYGAEKTDLPKQIESDVSIVSITPERVYTCQLEDTAHTALHRLVVLLVKSRI